MTEQETESFREAVWRHYDAHGRHDLPWRQPDADCGFDPYKILVSEIMLQQTQVARVLPKYRQFLELFPDAPALARAELGEVLVAWQGLGYNRRAKFLWQAARLVTDEFGGRFPRTLPELVRLPGVGANTAGAVMAYAYDMPAVFVETNTRTVFIHHFYADDTDMADDAGAGGVADKAILSLVAATLPAAGPGGDGVYRAWYWALMDYGSHLKRTVGNKSRASRSYSRQSPFHGSRRQVRGAVIRELGKRPAGPDELRSLVVDPRLDEVLQALVDEELIRREDGLYRLS